MMNRKVAMAAMEEMMRNEGTLWLWGFFALAMGAIMVVLNNFWTSGLELVITIIGWLALIKGIVIMLFPSAMLTFYKRIIKDELLMWIGLVALILGIVLLYLGFMI